MVEEWRPVVGHEGWYEISSLGRARSLRNRYGNPRVKMLTAWLRLGYPTVSIRGLDRSRPVSVHRLVAAAFLGPCPRGHEVNHKDFDRANPTLTNLEYVTHSENNRHAFQHGRRPVVGERVGASKLTDAAVREIRQTTGTNVEIARRFGVHPVTILRARKGEQWRHIV